jgi:hypothetical protein
MNEERETMTMMIPVHCFLPRRQLYHLFAMSLLLLLQFQADLLP